jgi:RNase P subunit RPR2
MADGGVLAKSFEFSATCSGCGGRLVAGRPHAVSTNVRRCAATCSQCGNVYRLTLTMIQEPGSRRDRL